MKKYDSSNGFYWRLNDQQKELYIIYTENQHKKKQALKKENIFYHKPRKDVKCGRRTIITMQKQEQYALVTSSGGEGGVGGFNNLTYLCDNEYVVEDMFCTCNYKYDEINKEWSIMKNNVQKLKIIKNDYSGNKQRAKLHIFRNFCVVMNNRIRCRDLWSNIFIIIGATNYESGLFVNYEDWYAINCIFRHFFVGHVCQELINTMLKGEFIKKC